MNKPTYFVISTGEIISPPCKVQRLKPNDNGNRPIANFLRHCPKGSGKILLQFEDGNTRPTRAALYDIGIDWGYGGFANDSE